MGLLCASVMLNRRENAFGDTDLDGWRGYARVKAIRETGEEVCLSNPLEFALTRGNPLHLRPLAICWKK